MKFLLVFCFAAVALAQDDDFVIDWSNIFVPQLNPAGMSRIPEQGANDPPFDHSRIVGGWQAGFGQFNYQVALFLTWFGFNGTIFCGASILSENFLLTAAHCVDQAINTTAFLGAYDLTVSNPYQIRRKSSNFTIHEQWDPSSLTHDIAVICLAESIPFNDYIQPIRLPSLSQMNDDFAGETAFVAGWGKDSDSATTISYILRFTNNPIITNLECSLAWLPIGGVQKSYICMSGAWGRSSCNGDSGGALVIQEADGKRTQIGIVSFGSIFGCELGIPSVYTRITSYMDWITANT